MINKKAFSLVELVVIIVILSILSTVAFLNYRSYPQSSRDAVRKTDLSNVKKQLEAYYIENGLYPAWNWVWKDVATMTWWVEKDFDKKLASQIWISEVKDPLTKKNYKYVVAKDRSWYFIESMGEENWKKIKIWSWPESCEQLRWIRFLAWLDFPNWEYVIFPNNQLKAKIVTCSWKTEEEETTTVEAPAVSCKELKNRWENSNWVYKIYPNWTEIDVYCDMTTDWGGWTLVVAQYENNPITDWNQWIQASYDPSLASKKSFVLKTSELPTDRTEVAFWQDLNPTYVWYSDFVYTTWNIAKTQVLNKKDSKNYHLHRDSAWYYNGHNPEWNTYYHNNNRNNTLTYDGPRFIYSWAFSPRHSLSNYRWHSMLWHKAFTDNYAWTVWVR